MFVESLRNMWPAAQPLHSVELFDVSIFKQISAGVVSDNEGQNDKLRKRLKHWNSERLALFQTLQGTCYQVVCKLGTLLRCGSTVCACVEP